MCFFKKIVGKLTVIVFQRFSNFEKRIQRPEVMIHWSLVKSKVRKTSMHRWKVTPVLYGQGDKITPFWKRKKKTCIHTINVVVLIYSAVGSHSRRRILEMDDSCYVSQTNGLRRMAHNSGWFMQCKMIRAPLDSSRRELSIGTKIVENGAMAAKLWAYLVAPSFCIHGGR